MNKPLPGYCWDLVCHAGHFVLCTKVPWRRPLLEWPAFLWPNFDAESSEIPVYSGQDGSSKNGRQ